MDSYALLLAATLNAGTVLALASLGLLINEKVGIVNLGAEGMMLCAAIAGFAAVVHTGNDWLGFAAGMGAGACWRPSSVAGDLAQHQPVRHRPGAHLFGAGFSAFVGTKYVQAKMPERASFRHSRAGRHPADRSGAVSATTPGLSRRSCWQG
jgi:ABC-type uncharacterized transport system permease subunit